MKESFFNPSNVLARCALVALLALLSACARAPRDRGAAAIAGTVGKQYHVTALGHDWQTPSTDVELAQSLAKPLSAEIAVQIALRNNPKMRVLYGELGIAQAELLDATRIANPTFDWLRSKTTESNLPAKLTFGVSQSVTDLLMLGARRKLANGILQRRSSEIAGEVATLIFDVESAYWHALAAEQVRAMRALVADSAALSSELAERFFSAGNINRVQHAQEVAAGAEAIVALKTAEANALSARAELSQLLGLDALDARVSFDAALPAMAAQMDDLDTLQTLAQRQRGDLAAARQNVTLLSAILRTSKRWRRFGGLDLSAERERETNGETLRGVGFSLGLPIFNQAQGSVLHATAMLEIATAQRDQLQISAQSEVALGLQKLSKQREIAQTYAEVLVPAREAAVAEMQKRYNFMLIGAFDLLQAKQAEYDAYQGYLDALRDYWIARSALKHAIGGELPSSSALDRNAKIGLPGAAKAVMDDMPTDAAHKHEHAQGAMPADPLPLAPIVGKDAYVCPMHADITSDKPGDCRICGMALEPAPAAPTGKSSYVCPMHEEITSNKPGDCRICGMALEQKTDAAHEHQHRHEEGETP